MSQRKEIYDHYYDDRLYLYDSFTDFNVKRTTWTDEELLKIKIPFVHKSTWGNGDLHLYLFFETVEQMHLLYKHHQVGKRVYPYQLKNEYRQIDYKTAKYSVEKLCRFYNNLKHGMPLENF